MKLYTVAIATLMFAGGAAGQLNPMRLVQPDNGLELSEPRGVEDLHASFRGVTWITGAFFAGWVLREYDEHDQYRKGRKVLEVQIVPDQQSRSRLPYIVNAAMDSDGDMTPYQMRKIVPLKIAPSLRILVGEQQARLLQSGRLQQVRGTGSFKISQLKIQVTCELLSGSAVLLKAHARPQKASTAPSVTC